MQTEVDRVVLLQQVSDYAVQQLLCQMQERLEHLENTLAAMVAASALTVAPAAGAMAGAAESVSIATELAQLLGNARLAAVLARAGYTSIEAVAAAPDAALLAVDGIGDKALKLMREKVG